MSKNRLSVVIVTKNRAIELQQCLGSLLSNSLSPDEIVVVDNNSSDQTKQLLLYTSANSRVPIKYVNCSKTGYPAIYNSGLNSAQYPWVAFIDDDCIADVNWVREIKTSIKVKPAVAAIMGWCGTYYKENIYSHATNLFDSEWKKSFLDGTKVLQYEILDTKNIVYNNNYLRKNKISFDETRTKYFNGAAQDCDLGIQIQIAGGVAICNTNIKILHKDPQSWKKFIVKIIRSKLAYDSLMKKWGGTKLKKIKKQSRSLELVMKEYSTENNINTCKRLYLLFVCKQVLSLNKVLQIIAFSNKIKDLIARFLSAEQKKYAK